MATMINNKVFLIISSNFDYAELIDNYYFCIYEKEEKKVSQDPSFSLTPFSS